VLVVIGICFFAPGALSAARMRKNCFWGSLSTGELIQSRAQPSSGNANGKNGPRLGTHGAVGHMGKGFDYDIARAINENGGGYGVFLISNGRSLGLAAERQKTA